MKAKTCLNRIGLHGKAPEYIRLVEDTHRVSKKEVIEPKKPQAPELLETLQDREPEGLDINITGKDLIRRLDSDFDDMGLVPYYFSKAARRAGEDIFVGRSVRVRGLPQRFRVVDIFRRYGSVRVRDTTEDDDVQYVFPWHMVRPWGD